MRATAVYGKGKTKYLLDGVEVTLAEYEAATPNKLQELIDAKKGPDGHRSACWPMASDAAGVNPEQRREAMEAARKAGVPTEFNREGQAIFTSREHRKQYCRLMGWRDRSGGWGDA
jgi:hypothetical protein